MRTHLRVRTVALVCGSLAFLLSSVAVVEAVRARGGSVTSVVGITPVEPLAAAVLEHDPDFTFAAEHLDGAYFYAIAIDPLARGAEHTLIDVPAYRYGHPGYGWAGWLLAAGRPTLVPYSLLFVALVSMFVAGMAASLLSAELGWSPWGGLFVAVNPGLIFATMADNSEPLALAVLALSLFAWMRERIVWAAVGFAVLCLIKEQFALVAVGVLVWELARGPHRAGNEARSGWLRRAALLSLGPVALGLWFAYLRSVFGDWPFQQQPLLQSPLTFPPFGYFDSVRRAAALHAVGGGSAQLGGTALPLLLVVGAALLIGIVRAWRLTSPIDPAFILLTVLFFSLTHVQLLYPKDLLRIAAVQLALLPAALAGSRRGPPPRNRPEVIPT